jgi:HSP20 family molecular chaperone IbpA
MTRTMMAQWNALQRKLAGVHGASGPAEAGVWQPNTDVYDGPDGLIVKVELGGVSCDLVQIYLQDRALVVEGVRRDPHSAESLAGVRLRQMEIEYGPFQRVIPLPYPVDGGAPSRIAPAACSRSACRARTRSCASASPSY